MAVAICGIAITPNQPIKIYKRVENFFILFRKRILPIIPNRAMAHCAMKINQPKTPPIATRAKGVYDPAIKIKIDEWSIIFRIPAALVNEKLWYKVEAKYRAHIEMPYTTYEKTSILFWFSTPLRIRKRWQQLKGETQCHVSLNSGPHS